MRQVFDYEQLKGKPLDDIFEVEDAFEEDTWLVLISGDEFAIIESQGGYDSSSLYIVGEWFKRELEYSQKEKNAALVRLGFFTQAELDTFIAEHDAERERKRLETIENNRTMTERYPTLVAKGIISP